MNRGRIWCMRDKHLIPLLQWCVRALYLCLRHIAQTKPGVVPTDMLEEGLEHYEVCRRNPYGNQDLEIK